MILFTLPFLAKKPIDVPPLVSVELIQISDITNIPYAPKAAKIIDKAKKEEKLLTEKAPPKKVEKEEEELCNKFKICFCISFTIYCLVYFILFFIIAIKEDLLVYDKKDTLLDSLDNSYSGSNYI